MRISTEGLYTSIINNLNQITEELSDANQVVASGKRINNLSDDPIGINKVLELRSSLSNMEQLNRNITTGRTWLNLAESALGSVSDLVVNAKTLCIQMATATVGPDERRSAAVSVDNFLEELKSLANTSVNGRYIFAGSKTDIPPFEIDGTYNGDSTPFSIKIGKNMNIEVGRDGETVFGTPEVPVVSTSEMTLGGGTGGTANETYTFTVTTAGTVGGNDAVIHWDNSVNSGDVSINAGAGSYAFDGINIDFGEGTLVQDDSFSLKTGPDPLRTPVEFSASISDCRANMALSTYTFTVSTVGGGTIGGGAINLDWECRETQDPLAAAVDTGTITIPGGAGDVTVDGMTVNFVSGILADGEQFDITTDVHKVPTLHLPSDWQSTATSGGEDDIFKTLADLKTALEADDITGISDQMGRLDSHLNQIGTKISDTGQKELRLDVREKIMTDLDLAYTTRMSKLEDADIVEALVELREKETVYQAALSSASKVMQMSLVDYL